MHQLHPTPLARRKVYFVVVGVINTLILVSVYFAYNRLPAHPSFTKPQNSTPPFSEYLRLSTPDPSAGLANPWTPLSLSRCDFGMPAYYAPCVARTLGNVVYAEELLYPDFEIREPYFAREEHRERWRDAVSAIKDRGVLNSGWVQYKGQSGQNFVFKNVTYTRSFSFDSWSPESCMSELVSTSPIRPLTDEPRTSSLLPTVLIAVSPDSYSFQHHLDRVTHIIAQGSHLTSGSSSQPYVVTGRKGSKTVQQLWERLGYDKEHVLYNKHGAKAEMMIFSCRAVLIHPWLSLKTLESLGVVYMSRSDGRTANPGRRVVNEDEVLAGIKGFLTERNRGEELVVFNPDEFENTDQLFSWFTSNVVAVIGPHGGSMINHRWATKDTLVIEFMPTTRTAMMIYEEASVLSQTYATIIVEPTDPAGTDMEIAVEDVLSLLREHLGVAGEDPLKKSYHWRAKELGL
ncbi:hypothetical protein B0H10DRAFT_2068320 [Mycena sp. CBHHK59/15]|nr:hypothetical protein B0H10DRAFT_2068320 [Mycena sp. CBHHK59/15]